MHTFFNIESVIINSPDMKNVVRFLSLAASMNAANSFLHVPNSEAHSTARLNVHRGKGTPIETGTTSRDANTETNHDGTRRSIISTAASFLAVTAFVQPSFAGEVGAKITKAVTTSDLGISVRRSVVKGAQIIDKLDGQWEKFSDDNGLGSARFNQEGRPKPREVPDLKPLDVGIAKQLLKISDDAFIEYTGTSPNVLVSQIEKVDGLVRKSYERSGLDLRREITPKEFDFYCYVHFRAYCDIIVEKKLPFNRKSFEKLLG